MAFIENDLAFSFRYFNLITKVANINLVLPIEFFFFEVGKKNSIILFF